ncbi:MAG: UvrD-helicase domain-containing protein [Gammaproteobacteria bacterium]
MGTETNTQPVDAEARRLAIDPAQSFIVQAPAGSGKTELLIQRYLALLATVEEPEEVVAITFTRKAAAEMRERILGALQASAEPDLPTDAHAKRTRELALRVTEKSQQRDWHITDDPSRLRIQTIDSLCASLVRQMPFLSRHGGQSALVEDTTAVYEEAAINTLEAILSNEYYSDSYKHLLLHLDNNLPRLQSLLQQILGKRDQWLRYIHADNSRAALEQSLAVLIQENLQHLRDTFPDEQVAELLALLGYAIEQLEKENNDLLTPCKGLQSLPEAAPEALKQWWAIADLLLTKDGSWRAQVNKNLGFPAGKDGKDKKEAMMALLDSLRGNTRLQELLHNSRLLPDPHYTAADWQTVDALCQLLKIAAAQLNIIFAGKGESDFIGIAEAANNALGDAEQPTDLALYLDYQIKHILIDEFQDISVNQFTLIERLAGGWQADDGHTLFMVGDPMQSIYGFREAEVGQFISTFHSEVLAGVRLQSLQLSVNFRSEVGIVDWINEHFVTVLPSHDDVFTGAVKFSPCSARQQDKTDPTAGRIEVYPFFKGQEAAEDQAVADIINTLRAEHDNDSIALLVRSRNHLDGILPLLREAGIPYQAIEIDSLAEQQYIQDLLALTRACLYPADRIAWLSVLRAPWCGLTLDDLFNIVNQDKHDLVWHNCQQALQDELLPAAAGQRLAALVDVLQNAFAQRQRHTLRHYIESVWCSLGGPATLQSQTELDNVETFFRLLAELDDAGRIEDIALLDEKIAALYALPDTGQSDKAIQVMTIHKAKGLEFDHVILPQLGRRPRPRQAALLMWMLQPDQAGHGHLLLSPINPTGQKAARLNNYLAAIDKIKTENEAARLLYVAATRARYSLHLLGQGGSAQDSEGKLVCKRPAGSLLGYLWSALRQQYQDAIDALPPEAVQPEMAPRTVSISRLAAGWRLPPVPGRIETVGGPDDQPVVHSGSKVSFDWAGETIKHIGTVVHRYLARFTQTLPVVTPELQSWVRGSLRQLGVKAEELDDACLKVKTALENIADDATGNWIFSAQHSEVKNEYALSGLVEGKLVNVVMDKTFVDDSGTRWIIDYKTSTHEGGDMQAFLQQQLLRYRDKMQQYGHIMTGLEQRPVMLGLYFPLLRGWQAWEFQGLHAAPPTKAGFASFGSPSRGEQ